MTKEILTKYKNGNYNVVLMKDGTKIRYNDLDNLTPAFAESIDCTITERCDGGCEYCYLGCTTQGKHADLHQPFFDTLHKGQELALNGNDLSHPELVQFLIRMKKQGVICNLTVNQKHFIKYRDALYALTRIGLIYGLGVSLTDSSDEKLYEYMSEFPNAVLHTIDGLLTFEDLYRLGDKHIKLLILGYKILGRGDAYWQNHKEEIADNISWLKNHIMSLADHFDVISFDNLAIEHLDMRNQIDEKAWEQTYMGDEGSFTYFIDAVNKEFALSSLSQERHKLLDNVDDMFQIVRSKNGNSN